MSLRDEVEKHYPRGWSFTPLGGPDGKRPILEGWQSRARETLDEATAWAAAGNVGLRTGSNSGIIVIDIDRAIELADLPPHLPATVTVRTGRGKLHLYYRFAGKWGNRKIPLGPNIDIRGDGGQVVFVGSKNLETTGEYRWVDGRSPEEIELAEFPLDELLERGRQWIAALTAEGRSLREIAEVAGVSTNLIHRMQQESAIARYPQSHRAMGSEPSRDGQTPSRDGTFAYPNTQTPSRDGGEGHRAMAQNGVGPSRDGLRPPPPVLTQNLKTASNGNHQNYAQKALTDECAALAATAKGDRNNLLNTAAFNLGQLVGSGYLDRFTVEASLKYACSQNGLADEDGIAAVSATIRSGIEAGIRKPRQIPERPVLPPRPPPPLVKPSVMEHVLIPGPHIDDSGVMHEVGNHHFAEDVVCHLPEGAVYRRDWIPGEIAGPAGKRKFIPLNGARTRIIVDSHMQLGRWAMVKDPDGDGKIAVRVFVPCSKDQASIVEEHCTTHARVRDLRLIANHPVFRSDWTVATPGYRDGVYYDEPDELRDLQPETDPEVIRGTLDDLLVDFPFKSEADRQNYIGLMLTPLVRPALGGNVPLHLIIASKERTGKSKLAEQVLGVIIRGEPTPAGTLPHSEEEQEKRITSMMLAGEPILHLDNIREFIDSSVLASLLTANTYTGRMLGQSKTLVIPNYLTLVGTGNNIGATGEMAKRTIPIILQPQSENPEDRTDFVHPNLPQYLRSVRRNVLACLLGMVRVWVDGGRSAHGRRLGGFEEWSEIVGGILKTSGFTEWRDNEQQWRREADPRGEDLKTLVEAWAASPLSMGRASSTELLQLAREMQLFPEVFTASTERGQQTQFAKKILAKSHDTPVAGYVIRRDGLGSNSRYRLEKSVVGGAGGES